MTEQRVGGWLSVIQLLIVMTVDVGFEITPSQSLFFTVSLGAFGHVLGFVLRSKPPDVLVVPGFVLVSQTPA